MCVCVGGGVCVCLSVYVGGKCACVCLCVWVRNKCYT